MRFFEYLYQKSVDYDNILPCYMSLYCPCIVPVNVSNLASILGVSEKTIKRDTAAMQSAGLIKRVGSDKKGHWKVVQ